jgi:hypothetical protein
VDEKSRLTVLLEGCGASRKRYRANRPYASAGEPLEYMP